MLVIIFLEGISKSALDTIILRNTYSFQKNYNNISYILFIELVYSLFKILILIFYVIIDLDLKVILYIGTISLLINSFIGYQEGENGYKTNC